MARVRSGARYAPRFGRQFNEGFQFRPPTGLMYTHGPWEEIMPSGNRDLPRSAMQLLSDGLISEGMIKPAWSIVKEVWPNRILLGAFELDSAQRTNHVIFYIDTVSGELIVGITATGVSLTYPTGISPLGNDQIKAVGWQNEVYFSSPEIGSVYKVNIVTGVVTNIPTAPGANFLFILNNNLVAIFNTTGLYWEIAWSVDSNLSDWTSAGAGSGILPGHLGNIHGAEYVGDSVTIIGSSGATRMSATGTLPAFRFDDLVGFGGTPYSATASDGLSVYLMGYNRKLQRYDMASVMDVGQGEEPFDVEPILYYSRRLRKVIVSSSGANGTIMLDQTTNKWNNNSSLSWTHMADSPRYGTLGSLIMYCQHETYYDLWILSLSDTDYLQPAFSTGRTRFPLPVHITHVDVVFTKAAPYAPLIEVQFEYDDNSVNALTPEGVLLNEVVRYWADCPVRALNINFLRPDEAPPWTVDTAIERIEIYARSLTNEQISPA